METCEKYNVRDIYKSWNFNDVVSEQKRLSYPFAVAVMNVQGDLNTGIIMRTATIFGAEKFFILGKRRFDRRSAVGSQNYIETHFIPTETVDGVIPREILDDLCNFHNYYPVFIEQGGEELSNIVFMHDSYLNIGREPRMTYKKKPLLIFGNESEGIPEYYMTPDDLRISITQRGVMRSLNVSSAAAIVIHKISNDLS